MSDAIMEIVDFFLHTQNGQIVLAIILGAIAIVVPLARWAAAREKG